jgi:hypothetical protein
MKAMNRVFLVLGAVALAALASAQVKMDVYLGGKKVGKASFQENLKQDGSLETTLVIRMEAFKSSLSITTVDLKDGMPALRSYHERSGDTNKLVNMTFTRKDVEVVKTVDGKSTKQTLPTSGQNLHSPSSFWFVRDVPKVGAVDNSVRLDENTFKWISQKVEYVGDDTLAVGHSNVKAHKLKQDNTTIWVDDKGLPVRIDIGTGPNKMVLQRLAV